MHGKSIPGFVVASTTIMVILCVYAAHWWVYHIVCHPTLRGLVLFNVSFVMAVWSYVRTGHTDPGTPGSKEWKAWAATRTSDDVAKTKLDFEADRQDPSLRFRRRRRCFSPGKASWCEDCQMERPERAHHCSQCEVCVLRMDHHCPWVGTCVGWKNHKYFILLNFWTFALCLVFLSTLRNPTALDCLNSLIDAQSGAEQLAPCIFVITGIVFLMITGTVFFYAFYLVIHNLTTIEDMYEGKNPYSYTSYIDNVKQMFGPIDYRVFFPIPPKLQRLPGTSWPIVGLDAEEGVAEQCRSADPQPTYGST